MQALTVIAGLADSAALIEMPEPPLADGPILVETIEVGICGTDAEICNGDLGRNPPACDRLVIGHEVIGRVLEAADVPGFQIGDLLVGIVRRPDDVPCAHCAQGEWDMCRTGGFTERGIRGRHGFASERFRIRPQYAIAIPDSLGAAGVLLEPASVVAKAWEHIDAIGRRAWWGRQTVVVTGAGSIGLLTALMAVQRGHEVHVVDIVADGMKPQLVADLGASYHPGSVGEMAARADVVIECTGAISVIAEVMGAEPKGVVCLIGVTSPDQHAPVDVSGTGRA